MVDIITAKQNKEYIMALPKSEKRALLTILLGKSEEDTKGMSGKDLKNEIDKQANAKDLHALANLATKRLLKQQTTYERVQSVIEEIIADSTESDEVESSDEDEPIADEVKETITA